jgi:hypothetical protein
VAPAANNAAPAPTVPASGATSTAASAPEPAPDSTAPSTNVLVVLFGNAQPNSTAAPHAPPFNFGVHAFAGAMVNIFMSPAGAAWPHAPSSTVPAQVTAAEDARSAEAP